MKMKVKMLCGVVAVVGVAGCDPERVTQSMHPDYVRHEVSSAASESDFTFLCAPQPNAAATKAQLSKAVGMTDAYLDAYAEHMTERMMSDDDFSYSDAYRLTRDSQKQAEIFVDDLKAETGCILVESE